MDSHVTVDRLQFTLTVTFHYLFPIITMGLGLFIAWLVTVAYLGREDHRFRLLRKTDEERAQHEAASRFWAKIFAINFAVGVVTGVPLEFQFGTNWAHFSDFAGGVIGQTLAMEGVFAFFAESVFLGIFLAGRNRVSPRTHWISALAVFAGSWLSGFFIIATNAWMQHPVAYSGSGSKLQLDSFWGLITNPWVRWQYLHNMSGAVISGAFLVAGLGALYLLMDRHRPFARLSLRVGVIVGLIACVLQIFPTGDRSAHDVAVHQQSTFAAMEGLFHTSKGAPLVIIGNPNVEKQRLDSSVEMPHFLSFLTSQRWDSTIRGLDTIPRSQWPDSVPLVYYAYHIMVGLGTILVVIAALAVLMLRRGRLYESRPMLWAIALAFPFTMIANIAGWTVTETGRQPWVVWGLLRTSSGASPAESVPSGTGWFTLLGFAGLYLLVGLLYVLFVVRILAQGPEEAEMPTTSTQSATGVA